MLEINFKGSKTNFAVFTLCSVLLLVSVVVYSPTQIANAQDGTENSTDVAQSDDGYQHEVGKDCPFKDKKVNSLNNEET